jgi:RNA polymerase sigma factor (sigma-70 family)
MSFARALARSAAALSRAGAPAAELDDTLAALHLDDLALVAACLEGRAEGWESLVARHQQALIKAGHAMAGDEGAELAEGLLGDLFGVDGKGRARRLPLESFHGRARLGTWLRTVLAQRLVDRWRQRRREEPMDDHAGALLDHSHGQAEARLDHGRVRAAVQRALDAALADIAPVDRARIALYYGRGLNLAEIGRVFHEHEATVSRKLARARRAIEQAVRRHLQDVEGLSPVMISEAVATLGEREGADVARWLVDDAERA